MRRISGILTTVLLALALTACGAGGATAVPSTEATQPSVEAQGSSEPSVAPEASEETEPSASAEASEEAEPSASTEASEEAEASEASEASPSAEASEATEASPSAEASAAETATETGAAGGATRRFVIVPEETEASYDVQEQFLNRDLPNRAVGTTNAVEGEFEFTAEGQPTGQVTRFRVDLRELTSDSGRRDSAIRGRWLESDTYPYADFVSTGVQDVPASYTEGEEITFKLIGDLTVREVTREVTFDVTGKLEGDTVTGTATTLVNMVDFGFDPPNIAGVLTVEDGVTITVNFTAKEG